MNDDIAFRELIVLAQEGNMAALNKLIDMYMPLVNKHSNINGRINEDLRQCILLKMTKNISKFKIERKNNGK